MRDFWCVADVGFGGGGGGEVILRVGGERSKRDDGVGDGFGDVVEVVSDLGKDEVRGVAK